MILISLINFSDLHTQDKSKTSLILPIKVMILISLINFSDLHTQDKSKTAHQKVGADGSERVAGASHPPEKKRRWINKENHQNSSPCLLHKTSNVIPFWTKKLLSTRRSYHDRWQAYSMSSLIIHLSFLTQ